MENIKTFFSPSGFVVYAGINAVQNEMLSTKFIEYDDYWFHAANVSGSHIILKTNSQPNVKVASADKGFCKQLATRFSKDKLGRCGVFQARGSQVYKIAGDAIGRVRIKTTHSSFAKVSSKK